jgi:uncharacterized protein YkwD
MIKKILLTLVLLTSLASCISVAVDPNLATPVQPSFVTAALGPTKQSFVPATLTPTPEIIVTPTLAITAPPNCKDGAVLLRDVTVQDNTQVKPSEKFTKTWEFQNTGTCPWTNYKLVFAAGDQMGAPLSAPIPDTAPNKKALVSVDLTAPAADGKYTGYFTLHNSDDKIVMIGIEKTFWVKIVVGTVSPQVTSTSIASITTNATNTPFVPKGSNSNCSYSKNEGDVQQIISLINEARAKEKLNALTANTQLMSAAQGHSADMACNNFLGHTGSDGSYINDRLSRAGYSINTGYSEIIAIGTPQDAMNQWRSDQPHWDIVLNAGFTQIGVGYAYYSSSEFVGYITVDLGSQ